MVNFNAVTFIVVSKDYYSLFKILLTFRESLLARAKAINYDFLVDNDLYTVNVTTAYYLLTVTCTQIMSILHITY